MVMLGLAPFKSDILIEDDRIAAIGDDLPVAEGVQIIDVSDKLVMPGLVNAHVHSWEAMFKGRYDNMPLELWMLYSYPILVARPSKPGLFISGPCWSASRA